MHSLNCQAYKNGYVYLDLTGVAISFLLDVEWPTIINADDCE